MHEAPYVEQFARQNAAKVKTVTIGLSADMAAARSFGEGTGMTTPIALLDGNHGVANHYGVYNYPSWVLINRSGKVVKTGTQFDDTVQKALNRLSN